jgi:putative oxidoreductase
MNITTLYRPLDALARGLNALQPLFALGTRLYVSWQFLDSGRIKITNWSSTIDLFQSEYHVPVLSPYPAAIVGTFGELFFPVLIVLGLAGRIGPLGLFAVNLMAVVSYSHVLLSEGFEAALGQHILWGFMLAMLAIYGNGPLSVDHLIRKRSR